MRACVLLFAGAAAQNPWVGGRREKTKEKNIGKIRLDDDAEEGDLTDFARLNKLVNELEETGGGFNAGSLSGLAQQGGGGMEDAFAGMAGMWESMLDSPEMKAMLEDPAALRAAIVDNPMLNSIPGVSEQVEAFLDSEAFKDPTKLKEAMKQGMDAFKTVGQEFTKELGTQMQDMLANPEAFQKTMADAFTALGGSSDELQQMATAATKMLEGGSADDLLGGLGGGDDATMAYLSKMPGMQELLSDPAALKAQMAQAQELFKSMGLEGLMAAGGAAGDEL